MNPEERKEKLEIYARAGDEVAEALARFPREMWTYKPGPDRWSIHEVLVHLADSEANGYVRCRRMVAEPGCVVVAYDEERWVAELSYHDEDPDEAAALFRMLRGMGARFLARLTADAWTRTMRHSERGEMTLDDWLAVYAAHAAAHIVQMRATHAAWLAAQRGEPLDPGRSLYPGS